MPELPTSQPIIRLAHFGGMPFLADLDGKRARLFTSKPAALSIIEALPEFTLYTVRVSRRPQYLLALRYSAPVSPVTLERQANKKA